MATLLVLEYDVERISSRHDATGRQRAIDEFEFIFQALDRELRDRAIDSPHQPARGLTGRLRGHPG